MLFSETSIQGQDWHRTVLLNEAIDGVIPEGGRWIVDGTLGGGGHSFHMLTQDKNIHLLGIDRDPEALAQSRHILGKFGDRIHYSQGSYASMLSHLESISFPSQVDGILLDLGVNSQQLDQGRRGFSFRHDGPLDMRFFQTGNSEMTAAEIVNTYSLNDLVRIFRQWGEEPRAKVAARAIVKRRETSLFESTQDLRLCLEKVLHVPKGKPKKQHPATRCFQALRIAVNEELSHLDRFLEEFPKCLRPGGRLAVISFHSLEDRKVKRSMQRFAKGCVCPSEFPECVCGEKPKVKILTKKPIFPSEEEIEKNPRSRSARLRVAERLVED